MEPRHGARYEEILALALATEAAGFDAFFRSDHLMGVDPNDPSYRPTDCWTTLGGLARETTRVRLGALVGAATFRQPGVLATILASVDEMSGGRVELGLGTAWYEREHSAFGIPFPPRAERFDRLEEQLAVITGLWSGPGVLLRRRALPDRRQPHAAAADPAPAPADHRRGQRPEADPRHRGPVRLGVQRRPDGRWGRGGAARAVRGVRPVPARRSGATRPARGSPRCCRSRAGQRPPRPSAGARSSGRS